MKLLKFKCPSCGDEYAFYPHDFSMCRPEYVIKCSSCLVPAQLVNCGEVVRQTVTVGELLNKQVAVK